MFLFSALIEIEIVFNNTVMIMLVSDKKTINEVMKILKNP